MAKRKREDEEPVQTRRSATSIPRTPRKTKIISADTPSKTPNAAVQLLLDARNDKDDKDDREDDEGFENYFDQVSRKTKTSNNTLSKLPTLDHKEYLSFINSYPLPYQDGINDLLDAHDQCFEEWIYELDANYSLCLYGYGSKRDLLLRLAARFSEEREMSYVVINGYHPHIDVRTICRSILSGIEPTATTADLGAVLAALDGYNETLLLVLHNIDGACLRNDKSQTALSQIVSHPNVRMVCSIDHTNAPRLWSVQKVQAYKMIYHDATTFLPYNQELEFQQDIFSRRALKLTGDRGVTWILQSLSMNAQKIFKLLVTTQIEEGNGIESARLFELASRAFLVSNQSSFQAQLGEFIDHELIAISHSSSGQILTVPFSKEDLQKLMDDL